MLCVVVALLLRLHQLDLAPFWMDEIATVFFVRLPWREFLGPIGQLESNPPGYYALMWLLAPLTGEGAFGMRLPSALAGAASVLPVHAYARRRFGNAAALLAAACLAVAATHVIQSQEARTYAILFLLGATTLWWLDRELDRGAPRLAGMAILLGLAGAALILLHATAAFAIAGLHAYVLAILVQRRALSARWIAMLVGAGGLTLLLCGWWLRLALGIARAPDSSIAWIAPPTLADIPAYLTAGLIAPYYEWAYPIAAAVLVLLLATAVVLAVRRRDAAALALLVAAAVAGGSLVLASLAVPVLIERTALILLVFLLPLFGWVLATLRPRALAVMLGLALLACDLGAIVGHYRTDAVEGRRHTPWARAVERVERRIEPGERAVIAASFAALALPMHAGERLRATRPYGALPPEGDRLGALVAARIAEVQRLDPAGACPAARGLWTIGFEDAAASPLAPLMARCGWTLASEEPISALRIHHWTAPGR